MFACSGSAFVFRNRCWSRSSSSIYPGHEQNRDANEREEPRMHTNRRSVATLSFIRVNSQPVRHSLASHRLVRHRPSEGGSIRGCIPKLGILANRDMVRL
jgi:hypothetical protein